MFGAWHWQGDHTMSALQQDLTLARDLAALRTTPIARLRDRYRALYRAPPPSAFGPDLLRRSIAQKLQEDAYGGLPPPLKRELARLVAEVTKAPQARIKPARRLAVGTVLLREWQGKSHRVTVRADGFEHDGSLHATLSALARDITGTRWNGPRFFGLRANKSERGR